MAEIFNCADPSALLVGARTARQAIARGELIVIPTDTVYGVAADAFNPEAVAKLLTAKGRGRQAPPPVMVADMAAIGALAAEIPEAVQRLADAFWPGPLTVVLPAQPSLSWDLGDTGGTVALRIPQHEMTLEILRETGPLAVSSANTHGDPAATTAAEADAMIGDHITAILDGGEAGSGTASTIIDATRVAEGRLRVLRQGGIGIDELADVCPELEISIAPKRKPAPGPAPEHSETSGQAAPTQDFETDPQAGEAAQEEQAAADTQLNAEAGDAATVSD